MTLSLTSHDSVRIVRMRWMLLAFMAGNVNAGGFMACHRFVTHVTGFGTFAGIELANGRFHEALGMLTVPFFFLLGAFGSGWLVDVKLSRNEPPRYDVVMSTISVCLLLATAGGVAKIFGAFGEAIQIENDFWLLALLCFASGLQNAVITSSTGAVIRTTHLTGLTTDLGIGLARILKRHPDAHRHHQEIENNKIRAELILSFVAGSIAGAFLFDHFQYRGFMLPALIALYATRLVFRQRRRPAKTH